MPEKASSTSSTSIEFLYFASCPNSVVLQANLDAALAQRHTHTGYTRVDLASLPALDKRRGYGSPTILVNGKDLLGTQTHGTSLSCRVYKDGVPSVDEIASLLAERESSEGD